MKPSSLVKRLNKHQNLMEKDFRVLNELISDLIEDKSAHFLFQPGDGLCVCWGEANNSTIEIDEIDDLFKMKKHQALIWLANNLI